MHEREGTSFDLPSFGGYVGFSPGRSESKKEAKHRQTFSQYPLEGDARLELRNSSGQRRSIWRVMLTRLDAAGLPTTSDQK